MKPEAAVAMFREMVRCNHPIYYFRLSPTLELQESDIPKPKTFMIILRKAGILESIARNGIHGPTVITDQSGLTWITDADSSREIHMFGPIFPTQFALYSYLQSRLEESIKRKSDTRLHEKQMLDILANLPVIHSTLYEQYVLILHYLLQGETLQPESIRYLPQKAAVLPNKDQQIDRMKMYQTEQAILAELSGRRINEEKISALLADGGFLQPYTEDLLLNGKIAITIFATLCAREAIQSGIEPELSLTVADRYIQKVFGARTVGVLRSIRKELYKDYGERIREKQARRQYAPQIERAIGFIDTHLRSSLTLQDVSKHVGLSPNHFSARFHHETGKTFSGYLREERLKKAALELRTTDSTIEKIAETAGFSARAAFDKSFLKQYGKTPAEYRRTT